MKNLSIAVTFGFLAILIVPVAITQVSEPESRRLESVDLQDLRYREVAFENNIQDLRLGGMLFVPDGQGPFPAAVLIHGSGNSRRDNGWYLTLTRYLQRSGIVVLLPDKRGSEKSDGDWRIASMADLATDTLAAIDYLRRQEAVLVDRIGVIGLSQGGMIAPVVGGRADDLDYLVNIVGAAVPMRELLVFEESHNLRQFGVLPGLSELLAYPAAWSIIHLRQRAFWSAVGDFDPLPYWRETAVRSLVLYGEEDTNVPSARSAELLDSLGNPRVETRIFAGSGHALEDPEGSGNRLFRDDALAEIAAFIQR